MSDTSLFEEKAPEIMRKLMSAFGLDEIQAAGILGNLGHESAGFRLLREVGQPEGRGGYGWAQWTGPRRRLFLDWCGQENLDWHSDDANYGFLEHELRTSQSGSIRALLNTSELEEAVRVFERHFEVAGVPNYPSRNRWARIALDAFNAPDE